MPITLRYPYVRLGHSMLFLLTTLSVLTALFAQAPTASAQTDENARVVKGTVTNGTSDGGPVAGLTALLHRQTLEGTRIVETALDEDGQFRFDAVSFDPAALFGVTVEYQGAVYGRDIDLSDGSPPPFEVTVYESSSEDSLLTIPRASIIYSQADKASQTLWAFEIIGIRNATDRTYVPGPGAMQLLRFGLPAGATDLRLDTNLAGAEVIQVDRGFALSAVVPPAEDAYEVGFSYQFPYSGDRASIIKSYLYGAESLRVLAVPDTVTLSSDQLQGPESVDIGGVSYQLMATADVPRGFRLSLDLLDLPQPSFAERVERRIRQVRPEYLAPAGLGLLLASLIGFALWRRRMARRGFGVAEVGTERDLLVREIARLEDRFDRGDLSEERYHSDRAALLARLTLLSSPHDKAETPSL